MKFHHVGVVVPRIANSLNEITRFIKFEKVGMPSNIDSQKVNVCFLKMGDFNLELIEPTESDSPISNFVSHGGGIHHLCFEVDDIQATFDAVIKAGGTPLGEITDFGSTEAAFSYVYMRDPEGNVIELEQR